MSDGHSLSIYRIADVARKMPKDERLNLTMDKRGTQHYASEPKASVLPELLHRIERALLEMGSWKRTYNVNIGCSHTCRLALDDESPGETRCTRHVGSA